jgi:phosphatidate cytidylyltransferase
MIVVGMIGFREFLGLAARLEDRASFPTAGYLVVPLFGIEAYIGGGTTLLLAAITTAVLSPLASTLRRVEAKGAIVGWSLTVSGSLYLGIPVHSAVVLRQRDGVVDAEWFEQWSSRIALGVDAAPRGLAWMLLVILAVWVGDTSAFLVGRTWGRRLLLPRVSPKKTVLGGISGLAGSAFVGAIAVSWFGLGVSPLGGAGIGIVLGVIGQIGDLAESLLKRQAGVKDSGTFIPGHGGILDRVDALLFALPVAMVMVAALDWWRG